MQDTFPGQDRERVARPSTYTDQLIDAFRQIESCSFDLKMVDGDYITQEVSDTIKLTLTEVQKALSVAFPALKSIRRELFTLAPKTETFSEPQ